MFLVHLKQDYFNNLAFQVSETLVRCAKELLFLNYEKILNSKHLTCEIYIRNHAMSCQSQFSNINL